MRNRGQWELHRPISTVIGLALLFWQSVAQAQEGTLIDEVIVTAQKRSQSVQDIGFSVNAFDREDAARFSDDVGALAGQAPGVESFANNTTIQSFFIRGIGLNEFASNFNQPVAVHKDEVYVSKNWMSSRPTFDVERIEILKGPQGTLFGRNTTGGAVNYYHTTPTKELEGYMRMRADEHSRYSVEGAVGGSITDALSGRLSFYRSFGSGGPQYNEFTRDDHGEPDLSEIRGQLEWQFESTMVRVMAYAGTDKSEVTAFKGPGIFNLGAPTFCDGAVNGSNLGDPACFKFSGLGLVAGDPSLDVEPSDIDRINQNQPSVKDDDFYGGYIRIEHDLGESMQIVSLTSYDKYTLDFLQDADSTPIRSADLASDSEIEAITQEVRLVGAFSNIEYVAGVFYSSDEQTATDAADLSESLFHIVDPTVPFGLIGDYEQDVDSFAVFANGDIQISEPLTLTLGARYTRDETDVEGATFADVGTPIGRVVVPVDMIPGTLSGDRTDSDVSWRVGLSYDLNQTSMVYTNVTTGFRTGGYSIPFGSGIVEFEDEKVTSFEVGYKADLADNLRLNAAAFYFEYDDLQANVDDPDVPLVQRTENIDKSETYGLEAELTWLPVERLELQFGYSYLDAEFTEASQSVSTISNLGPIPLEGKRPLNTPEHQLNGTFRYSTDITDGLGVAALLDFRWSDDRYLEVTNQPADAADSYAVANASFGVYSTDDKWNVNIWVRNLSDEEYLTYINNVPGAGFQLTIYGEVRTVGIEGEYRF